MEFGFRPIQVAGRTYLYTYWLTTSYVSGHDWDAEVGGRPDGSKYVTRALLEVSADGVTHLDCAWGPRPRPEEFLTDVDLPLL